MNFGREVGVVFASRYGLQTGVILGAQTFGLPTDEWLMPQALKDAGYSTAIIRKWHLGHGDRKYWPRQRGFDYQYGPLLGEIDYYTHKEHGVVDWFRDNKKVDEPGYVIQLLGKDAVKYINEHDTKTPMFLYLAFTAPHAPYQAPQDYIDRYKNIPDPTRRIYAGMITCMDDEIGKVLEALDKRGMRENTLVVFQSDNGGNRSAMFAGENVEPFRAAIRQGDWKLIWRTLLPCSKELYNVVEDPSEKNDLASQNAERVQTLQNRAEELARESAKSMFLMEAMRAAKSNPGTPIIPEEDNAFSTSP